MASTVKLLAITVASLVIWAVAVRVLARLTRPRMPRAAPATSELRDDPPAVVNLLVNRGRPNEDAARATLLDLAARRIIEISQPGDDPLRPVVQIRERQPQGLTAYENRIFDRLRRTAPDGRLVPLAALTDAYAQEGFWWWDSFRREVRADAKKAGYTDDSWFSWSTVLLMLGAFWIAMLIGTLALLPFYGSLEGMEVDPEREQAAPGFPLIVSGCVCLVVVTLLVLYLLAYHDFDGFTRKGNAATSHWLGVANYLKAHEDYDDVPAAGVTIWDRYLAQGVALGTNPVAAEAIDLRTKREEIAWSRHTGQWRRVVVRHPHSFSPFGAPAGLMLIWTMVAVPAWSALAWYGVQLARDTRAAWVIVAFAGWRLARNVYQSTRAVADLIAPVSFTGTLLTFHAIGPTADEKEKMLARYPAGVQALQRRYDKVWMRAVVDDGRSDRLRPWQVSLRYADGIAVGDLVTVTGQRFGRYAKRITAAAGPSTGGPGGR